jgi:hypothetical protein
MDEESSEDSILEGAHPSPARRNRIRKRLREVSARMSQLPPPEFTTAPMNDEQEFKLERLTRAVWVLSALVALNLAVTLLFVVYPTMMTGGFVVRAPGPGVFSGSPTVSDFDPWQMKKEVDSASAIAITRHVKEGNRLRAVVSEIVRRKPGTQFSYKIGDEIESADRILKEGVDYGDGTTETARSFFSQARRRRGALPGPSAAIELSPRTCRLKRSVKWRAQIAPARKNDMKAHWSGRGAD